MIMQKLGVQAYTLRNEMETDFIGGLEQVRRIGYEAIEFAGFHGVSIRDVKEACDRLGLVPVSSHVPIEKLESSKQNIFTYFFSGKY